MQRMGQAAADHIGINTADLNCLNMTTTQPGQCRDRCAIERLATENNDWGTHP